MLPFIYESMVTFLGAVDILDGRGAADIGKPHYLHVRDQIGGVQWLEERVEIFMGDIGRIFPRKVIERGRRARMRHKESGPGRAQALQLTDRIGNRPVGIGRNARRLAENLLEGSERRGTRMGHVV